MRRPLFWLLLPPLGFCGCGDDKNGNNEKCDPEILQPEPAGAPTQKADGRLTCLGDNAPSPPSGGGLELVGYVRTLADPDATQPAAAQLPAQVEAFDSDDTSLGVAFADRNKVGRAAVGVPITSTGFVGYTVTTCTTAFTDPCPDDYIPWRMHVSRPVTDTTFAGWTWLTTQAEADTRAAALGITLDPAAGILVGVIHDCDGFGVENAVIEIDGSTSGLYFVEGFDVVEIDTRTFTSSTGRFLMPNRAPGPVDVKAFGRLAAGGPLTLLSSVRGVIEAGRMTALALQPRVACD